MYTFLLNTMVLVQKQHPKRHRVSFTQNLPKETLQDVKNPNAKKPSSTTTHSSCLHIGESLVSYVYEYLHEMEMQKRSRPMVDYIEKVQKLFTPTMRGSLVDWLVEVGEEYKLLPDTLHLSVSYIGSFLSVNPVTKSRLQLLGVSSMLIASKYEEIDPPCVDDFCSITDHTYDKAEVVTCHEMRHPSKLSGISTCSKSSNALQTCLPLLMYQILTLKTSKDA